MKYDPVAKSFMVFFVKLILNGLEAIFDQALKALPKNTKIYVVYWYGRIDERAAYYISSVHLSVDDMKNHYGKKLPNKTSEYLRLWALEPRDLLDGNIKNASNGDFINKRFVCYVKARLVLQPLLDNLQYGFDEHESDFLYEEPDKKLEIRGNVHPE